jgi:hypothetical protein
LITGRHDQQNPLLPPGNRFDCPIDGNLLIVAGRPTGAVEKVVVGGNCFLLWGLDPFVFLVTLPEFFGRGELVQGKIVLDDGRQPGTVMVNKAIPIGTDGCRQIEDAGIVQRLLQPGAYRMIIVFRFDNCNGDIGFVIEDEVSPFSLTAGGFAPLTKMRPSVKKTSSRTWRATSQPAFCKAGTMNWVQMSRSESSFLEVISIPHL